MDLSVIIVNYQTAQLVKYQLKNLLALPIRMAYEIIVVDNASGDNLATTLGPEFPTVNFLTAEANKGYAAGNNLGIHHAQGKYILILNPDITVLDAGALERLVTFMDSHQEVGIAGPRLVHPNGELQESYSRWPSLLMPLYRRTWLKDTSLGQKWLSHYFYRDWDHSSSREVDWLFGAALIVRKEALVKVGLLDETFFLYLEDTDWCRRFWEAGYQVWYVADAEFIHYHKRESAESGIFQSLFYKSSREHIKSFFKLLWKYRGKSNPHG
ncbi:MAG: glycosyltransferase family 2 protein [Candidatus Komeilibacteria bacterium]